MTEIPVSVAPDAIKVACSTCSLRELCMPVGLDAQEMLRIETMVSARQKVLRGANLFRAGDPFTALYAIRVGTFKTTTGSHDGRHQVTGFQMAGEIMGLDGIARGQHTCDAVALEDAEACVLPFDRIEEIAREVTGMQRHLYRVMSGEIVRENGVLLLLGSRRAEERVAAFLSNLVQRLQARGFSPHEVVLRMTREEIGSYLGLTLETVSRAFSKLAERGVIAVNHRHVRILELEALNALVDVQPCR